MATAASASLVKYDSPVLVSTGKKGAKAKGKKEAGASEGKSGSTQTEDILNSILPPREWTAEGQLWVQYVSSTPATPLDVINLQQQLDLKLQQRHARETGICPIREELYAQCFDELIRQVTINCAERGLLLLRVRDEVRMTISNFQTLYESSIAFGMRKALMAEQKKAAMAAKIKALQADRADLENQVSMLQAKCDEVEAKEKERIAAEDAKHAEEVESLKEINERLKKELESILAAPKTK